MVRISRIDLQVREETVVRLEAEHVDGVAALVEKHLVVFLDQADGVLEEGLRVQSVRVKVQRQDALVQDAVQPECSVSSPDDFKDADQDL